MLRRPPRSTLFPTRRSSDLREIRLFFVDHQRRREANGRSTGAENQQSAPEAFIEDRVTKLNECFRRGRSEEHTSELQSLTNLVCRLLLEKKKNKKTKTK